MDRLNLEGFTRRLRRGQRPAGQSRGLFANRGPGAKWGLAIVLGLVACMVLTVASSALRRSSEVDGFMGDQLASRQSSSAPNAMPTVEAMAEEERTRGLAFNAYMGEGNEAGKAPEAQARQPATGGGDQATYQNWDRMIIRTATLQIRVKDVNASVDEVRAMAGAHGGYVSQTDSRIEGEYTFATITLQVPAREFDSVMSKLRKVGLKVESENVSSSDVTEEYTDLQSQLRNLQATETRILALMQRAERIEDILTLDRELRQIQGEIERIQGRLNYLKQRSDMSTITVSLFPEMAPVEPKVEPAEGWDPVRIIQEAWDASLELLSSVATVVLSVVVFMWWAVPLLLLAAWLMRRPRRDAPVQTPPPGEPA